MAEMIRFREYGAQVIRERLVTMLSHADGVRLAEDIEALHDMRVASRRLRAALSMFAPALRDPDLKRFEMDVKAVTDALGVARDLDVMIDTLVQLESDLPEGERAGMDEFVSEKRAERSRIQQDVIAALDRLEKQNLLGRFDDIVGRTAQRAAQASVSSEPPAGAIQAEV